jgi:hypothetical protein
MRQGYHHDPRVGFAHLAGPNQGNESRLTWQHPQYFQQVFWVPSGALATSLDGTFVCGLAHQIEGEVADDGHILGAVTDAQA